MAIHCSTLAWRIPWTEESVRLQSMGSQRVGQDWVTEFTHTRTDTYVTPISWLLWTVLQWTLACTYLSNWCFLFLQVISTGELLGHIALLSSSFWGLSILYSGCTDLHSHQQCTSVPLLHTFFLLGEKLCNCDYPPICGIPTQRSRSSSYYFSTALPPTFHIWLWLFLYIFSCGKMFAASLQVVLVDRCSVNCCDFGVSWEKVGSGSSYSAFLATPLCIISNNVVEFTTILTWKV